MDELITQSDSELTDNESLLEHNGTVAELESQRSEEIANKNSKFRNKLLNYLVNDTKPLYIGTVMEEEDQKFYTFRDVPTVPDSFHEYPDTLQAAQMPIIIDNGSYMCRVGWASDSNPRLTFKNVIAKQTRKKDSDVAIGNDISNLEVVRWQLKSPFDRNVVTQFDAQEQIFDYIFSHLGINSEGCVDHPVVITEPLCNPNCSRQQMSELLFECYHVPEVAYAIDSLLSVYHNVPTAESATGLVVACGYQATHVMPVVDGRVKANYSRRINVGGSHVDNYMQRLLQLKYPGHYGAITLSRAEELVQHHCYLATDYAPELTQWGTEQFYFQNAHKFQLPLPTPVAGNTLTPEQKQEKKEQQIRRLKELHARKRCEKLALEQEKLQQLISIQELLDDQEEQAYNKAMKKHGLGSAAELQEAVSQLQLSIQKTQLKMLQDGADGRGDLSFDLVGVPDDQLTTVQRETKKRQVLLKAITESQTKKSKSDKKYDYGEAPVGDDESLQVWIKGIRKQRMEILNARMERKQRKAEMTKRRTHASQQRMKMITELAKGLKRKKDDSFGKNDQDWNVYRQINKDAGDSDSEAEQEKLDELETLLREYDMDFKDPNQPPVMMDLKEYYRLHIGVERIRVPEVLFQPSLIGIDQAGIAETIEFVLKKCPVEMQDQLVQRVFLTGGCAKFPNFKERIERELLAMRPFQSTFKVYTAQNPALDAWYGARKMAVSPGLSSYSITKADYMEYGGEYLAEHFSSNCYVPTPVLVQEAQTTTPS